MLQNTVNKVAKSAVLSMLSDDPDGFGVAALSGRSFISDGM